MASITIRDFDATLIARLSVRAAAHGRSIEEEAREILRDSLPAEVPLNQIDLATSIRRHLAPIGGVNLVLPPRAVGRRKPRTALR
jgi:antitoxin FitA